MKICYTNFHQGDGGGHTTYVIGLVRSLAKRHTIWVVAPETSRLYQEAGAIPGVKRLALQFSTKLSAMWRDVRVLRGLLRSQSFDIVHVNGSIDHRYVMLASLAGGAWRPRIIFTKHNDLPAGTLGNTIRAKLATDRVICVSGSTRDQLESTAYQQCGLRVIRNGVDTEHYAPWSKEAARKARDTWLPSDLSADAILIGSNAGVSPHKGWLDMVEAVAGLSSERRNRIYIMLAGQPFNQQDIANIAALNMTDRVIHAGLLTDVRPFIATLDIGFVLSYRVETISFACREMMSMGKPVIVTDTGGLAENITNDVDGWVVPARTPAAVSSVLNGLLDSPSALAQASLAARTKSMAEFGMEAFIQSTEQVYKEFLN